ncbi:hypothetical protein ACIA5E_19020 [Nocardia asteroides]|uniref:hypothetical protein n=1 Tax=Nocardia asteroides TaxID=1824 RepID=UPI003788E2BF
MSPVDESLQDCPRCGSAIEQPARGRRRRWCSDECRRRGSEAGIVVHEVVRERVVSRPERISTENLIARLLDEPAETELLLRAMAHRWRTQDVAGDDEARQRMAPILTEVWAAFHARTDPKTAQNPPPKLPTAAAEHRAAVDKVLSSPRSTATVLNRVADRLRDGDLPYNNVNAPVLNAVANLAPNPRWR